MVEQKKHDTHLSFDFLPDGVKYSMKDKNHAESFTVPYEDITRNTSTFEERSQWFRNVAIYLAILGAIALAYNITHGKYSVPIWLPIAAVFFVMYRFIRVSYTVLDCANHRLYVIQDKYHDQILKTIEAWRCERLLTKYGTVDQTNDPNAELRKFQWLHSEGVITDEDVVRLRKELALSQ